VCRASGFSVADESGVILSGLDRVDFFLLDFLFSPVRREVRFVEATQSGWRKLVEINSMEETYVKPELRAFPQTSQGFEG